MTTLVVSIVALNAPSHPLLSHKYFTTSYQYSYVLIMRNESLKEKYAYDKVKLNFIFVY